MGLSTIPPRLQAIYRQVLLLLPIFFNSWWSDSFITTYNATYFTVRTRALSAFITPFAGNLSSIAIGAFLDSKIATRRRRSLYALFFFLLFNYAIWAYLAANIAHYNSMAETPEFDWTTNGFARSYIIIFLTNMEELGVQTFLYYILGTRKFAAGP